LWIPLKEEIRGESRGDGGEIEGDFTNNLYFSNNVSLELIYVGWYFGDCHYNNFRVIFNYNSS
jgi:hypothetical protein